MTSDLQKDNIGIFGYLTVLLYTIGKNMKMKKKKNREDAIKAFSWVGFTPV